VPSRFGRSHRYRTKRSKCPIHQGGRRGRLYQWQNEEEPSRNRCPVSVGSLVQRVTRTVPGKCPTKHFYYYYQQLLRIVDPVLAQSSDSSIQVNLPTKSGWSDKRNSKSGLFVKTGSFIIRVWDQNSCLLDSWNSLLESWQKFLSWLFIKKSLHFLYPLPLLKFLVEFSTFDGWI